jgi:NADPH:quinone reductase-like Zn-dependent oxidoreductase
MKAVVFHEHGGPEQLRYEERPEPQIKPDEVLVRVKACALNHLDLWVRQGIPSYHVPLPHISGCDVAGIVQAVGPAVVGVAAGDRVFVAPGISCWSCEPCLSGRDNHCSSYRVLGAQVDGGYAELVAVPARNVLPIPGSLTFEQAAAFPLVSLTAWHMVVTLAQVQAGESVLVIGAGSGVGSMAVQLARVVGARVMTTVGSDDKIHKAEALGASVVVNHSSENLAERVRQATGGRGVDVVVEHVGPTVFPACLKALAKGGRLVTCGATTGGDVGLDLRYVFSRELTVKGAYLGTRRELLQAASLVGNGAVTPVIDRVFPLQEARRAQQSMLDRTMFGKLVLSVN